MRKVNIIFVLILLALALLFSGCGKGQLSATCMPTKDTSAGAPPHSHNWCVGETYTRNYCTPEGVCHKHKLNEPQNIAEAAGEPTHTHTLK
jgi:hypothetical protein